MNKLERYKYENYPKEKINSEYLKACEKNNLELVKYLLLNPKIINADIDYLNYSGISMACNLGHNEIVMFLLTSKELKKNISHNIKDGALLVTAVEKFNLKLMDYFLKVKKMDLNINSEYILKRVICKPNGIEIIKCLIVDYNLEKTERISNYLEEKNFNIEEKAIISKMFEQRDLMELMTYVFNDDDKKKQSKIKVKKI